MGHVLPRALYQRFSVLFHCSGLAEPSQESTQYAGIASVDAVFPLVMLQESIHYFPIQILERDTSVLKPSTEIGDHHDLISDRVPRITLQGYRGSVSVKMHAQRPLAQPFNRAWKSKKLVYHSPRMPVQTEKTMPRGSEPKARRKRLTRREEA